MVFSTQEFFLFTQELIHFTQEILHLLPKKFRTPYSRKLRVPSHDRRIVRAAVNASRKNIRAHVAPGLSPRTTGNRLLAAGVRSRVSLARLPLTPQHYLARLLWCRERVNWRVEWRFVIFSDESRFCLYASDLSDRWGNTPEKPRPGNLSRPGIEPGPAALQAPAPQRWTWLNINYK